MLRNYLLYYPVRIGLRQQQATERQQKPVYLGLNGSASLVQRLLN
jgi:hypothetical protein